MMIFVPYANGMAQIQTHISLLPYNTFGIEVAARWFLDIDSVTTLTEFLMDNVAHELPMLILGGGSNLLFTQDFPGVVLKNRLLGKEIVQETADHVYLKVASGENWHQLVEYCVAQDWSGIENLALIPGSVGAAPIQNIGAYGVSLSDVLYEVEALDLKSAQKRVFSVEACELGYRDSIFKRRAKGHYFLTAVTLKLNKTHQLNTSYGSIQQELAARRIATPRVQDIAQVVVDIRQSKLPDPAQVGNAGSFFKNPLISQEHFARLQATYPDMPHYVQPNGQQKLAAAWLIQQCGWKGKRIGDYGVYPKQALVLVNYGQARGKDIWALAEQIQASVLDRFAIKLEPEVNVI